MHLSNYFLIIALLLLCVLSFSFPSLSKIAFKKSQQFHMSDDDEVESSFLADDAFGAPVGPLPGVSSRINFGDQTPTNIQHDLWVVGAGTLGIIAAQKWKNMFPSASVVAESKSDRRHSQSLALGIHPRLRNDRTASDEQSAKNLLVCLPPSSSTDYVGEINLACRLWAGPLGNGKMVFTSSTAVYGESFGNIVNEKFRLDTRSQRSTTLIAAEEAILTRQGSVLRLAGLYDERRGPHTFWLKNGTVQGSSDGFINLLHYDDAAEASIAAILNGKLGGVYLVCDDAPMSRQEICACALQSGLFPDWGMPSFAAVNGGPQAKIVDDAQTRKDLNWKPKYRNFGEFMVSEVGGKTFALDESVVRPGSKKAQEKKSALWLPGDEDDLF